MRVSDFHYDLPPESIAQEPLPDRANSRLLHLLSETKTWQDQSFRDFPSLLRPTDLLVFNNTRVFPARLFGHRCGPQAPPINPHNPGVREFLSGEVEVLLTKQISQDPNEWVCLVRPGKKIGIGEKLLFEGSRHEHPSTIDAATLEAEVVARGTYGERRICFRPVPDFFARLERLGHVPLPPYIARADRPADRDRYQTVYARHRGSVAAPTAGLHFTPEILQQIHSRSIETIEITLHVGLGTFQPVREENVEDHQLHSESYEISNSAAKAINNAKSQGRRVVAIGTTTVRTLEFAAKEFTGEDDVAPSPAGGAPEIIRPGRGDANIFIYPGYKFRVVDALLTNFHLPESSLLMLVSALAGTEFVLSAYRHAVQASYRFYSYGDCMFVD
jgi:S-adenosylmethionine:tRNA ribosyltransferase-isomerase